MPTLMHLLAFQTKTGIVESIQMKYLSLSVSLEVWIFLRSVGRIFDNTLLNQKIVLFPWVSEDESCFVWCLASLVKVVCLYLK